MASGRQPAPFGQANVLPERRELHVGTRAVCMPGSASCTLRYRRAGARRPALLHWEKERGQLRQALQQIQEVCA